MKAGVIVFPGSNCDRDVYDALNKAGFKTRFLWHKETNLPELDLVVLPGGFSYGDYLRCGAIAAKSPIMLEVIKRANQGLKVLGICNGFQILCETGLLPGALLSNKRLKFICRKVHLKVENTNTIFTQAYTKNEVIGLPIAHHDGNYFVDNETLKTIEDNGQVVFRYADEQGTVTENSCPNGAINNIAGIINKSGNVLGMMPHPERASDSFTPYGSDGFKLFSNLIKVLT